MPSVLAGEEEGSLDSIPLELTYGPFTLLSRYTKANTRGQLRRTVDDAVSSLAWDMATTNTCYIIAPTHKSHISLLNIKTAGSNGHPSQWNPGSTYAAEYLVNFALKPKFHYAEFPVTSATNP